LRSFFNLTRPISLYPFIFCLFASRICRQLRAANKSGGIIISAEPTIKNDTVQLSTNYFMYRRRASDINPSETITCAKYAIKILLEIISELRFSIDKTTWNYHKLSYNTHNFRFTSFCRNISWVDLNICCESSRKILTKHEENSIKNEPCFNV
jgi:hypothetical protein